MPLVARKPTQDLINLVGSLGGRWHGRTAMCLCPAHADKTPSLAIRQGDRGILVTCFAGCHREDILRELARVRITPNHRYVDSGSTPTNSENAVRLWDEAQSVQGTLGERYLGGRFLLPVANDIRFHPRCPYRPKPHTTYHPALLIAIREGRKLVALQRIFLDAATTYYTMKLTLGLPGQGAWQGQGRPGSVLALAEGFETARAFTILNDFSCWSCLGARRFDQVRLPDSITHLMLAHDNDAEGRRAAGRAEERYARPGLFIERTPPEARFKDWAQALERSRHEFLKLSA